MHASPSVRPPCMKKGVPGLGQAPRCSKIAGGTDGQVMGPGATSREISGGSAGKVFRNSR